MPEWRKTQLCNTMCLVWYLSQGVIHNLWWSLMGRIQIDRQTHFMNEFLIFQFNVFHWKWEVPQWKPEKSWRQPCSGLFKICFITVAAISIKIKYKQINTFLKYFWLSSQSLQDSITCIDFHLTIAALIPNSGPYEMNKTKKQTNRHIFQNTPESLSLILQNNTLITCTWAGEDECRGCSDLRDCGRLENLQSGHCSNASKQGNAVLSSACHEWHWNKEVDFSLLHQLTFLLSACTGGSRALERSAIFCRGANKETVSFFHCNFLVVVAIVPHYPLCATQLNGTGAASSCLNAKPLTIHRL